MASGACGGVALTVAPRGGVALTVARGGVALTGAGGDASTGACGDNQPCWLVLACGVAPTKELVVGLRAGLFVWLLVVGGDWSWWRFFDWGLWRHCFHWDSSWRRCFWGLIASTGACRVASTGAAGAVGFALTGA